jgi:septal ring factor EnvC (AmiA/AmiB activator)
MSVKFATVTIGALTMTDNLVSVASNKPLILGQDATLPLHATTKSQLDAVAAELRGAISTIAGTDTALDTLADQVESQAQEIQELKQENTALKSQQQDKGDNFFHVVA